MSRGIWRGSVVCLKCRVRDPVFQGESIGIFCIEIVYIRKFLREMNRSGYRVSKLCSLMDTIYIKWAPSLFWGSASCCAYFIKVRKNRPSQQLFEVFIYILYIFPVHVSALAGHLQAKYTIFLRSYFTHNGSVDFVRQYLPNMCNK
jgi:hypothetical protein